MHSQPERSRSETELEQQAPEERPATESRTGSAKKEHDDIRAGQEMRRDTPFKKEWEEQTPRRPMKIQEEHPEEPQEPDTQNKAQQQDRTEGAQGRLGERPDIEGQKGREAAYAHQPGQMTTRVMSPEPEDEDQLRTRERELESIGIEEAQGSRIDELAWLETSKKEEAARKHDNDKE